MQIEEERVNDNAAEATRREETQRSEKAITVGRDPAFATALYLLTHRNFVKLRFIFTGNGDGNSVIAGATSTDHPGAPAA